WMHLVSPGSGLTISWASCDFTYTNTGAETTLWCDTNWASQFAPLARNCIPKGFNTASCTDSSMALIVSRHAAELFTTPTDTATGQAPTSTSRVTGSSTSERGSTASTSSSTRPTSASGSTSQTSNRSLSASMSAHTSAPQFEISQTSEGAIASAASVSTTQGSGDTSTEESRHRLNTAVIAGVVATIVVILLILLMLWLLWRRRRRPNAPRAATTMGANDGSMMELIQNERRTVLDISPSPTASIFTPSDPPIVMTEVIASRTSLELIPDMPGFPPVSGSPNTPAKTPDVSASNTSRGQQYVPQVSLSPSHDALPEGDWSARSLAQALVPQLSESDLERLANSIVTRMPVVAPIFPHDRLHPRAIRPGQAGSEVGTQVADDPPPPWRESWNSSNGGRQL
ncbi:hypothetical protein FRC20_003904, partial [Serendipita sp. 405]